VGFEPAITASEQPQTHASDRAATGMGTENVSLYLELDFQIEILKLWQLLVSTSEKAAASICAVEDKI
jgi:hypothetical protein